MKKAELTTQQIVILIVIVASFAILLFFIFKLNLTEINEDQLCRDSVIKSSYSSSVFPSGKLECKTRYVCISAGGECSNFNPSHTIEVDFKSDKNQNQNVLFRTIAEEISNCWWMFGEGDVNYAGFGWDDKIPIWGDSDVCGQCSVIAFDEKVIEGINSGLKYRDFYSYLSFAKNEQGLITYSQYLQYPENIPVEVGKGKLNILGDKIDFNERQTIVTGMYEKEKYLPAIFIPSSKLKDVECKAFVTIG